MMLIFQVPSSQDHDNDPALGPQSTSTVITALVLALAYALKIALEPALQLASSEAANFVHDWLKQQRTSGRHSFNF